MTTSPTALASPDLSPIVGSRAAASRIASFRRLAVALLVIDGLVVAASTSLIFPSTLDVPWSVAIIAASWALVASLFGVHRGHGLQLSRSVMDEVPRVLVWGWCCLAATALIDHSITLVAGLMLLLTVVVGVLTTRTLIYSIWRRIGGPDRLLVVGSDEFRRQLSRKIALERTVNAEIRAHIDVAVLHAESPDRRKLGTLLSSVANDLSCTRVVVSLEGITSDDLRAVAVAARSNGLTLSLLPPTNGVIGSHAKVSQLAELPILDLQHRSLTRTAAWTKRFVDIAVSSLLLMATAPVMAAIAVAIRVSDGGPAFYRQQRGGLSGKPFTMIKLRTMVVDADDVFNFKMLQDPVYKLQSDPRVTRLGAFLRSTSLDELPQLLNVLRGEMSLVGPRPEDIRLVQRYTPAALAIRCGMRPGITGPMQVHGRGDLSFHERLDLERDYVENYSLATDLRILALTFGALLPGHGAY
jgi:exopolysaccharide biosynthesis polyprenyl glycosylphosphotransferase